MSVSAGEVQLVFTSFHAGVFSPPPEFLSEGHLQPVPRPLSSSKSLNIAV
jgi:hypothetical protein